MTKCTSFVDKVQVLRVALIKVLVNDVAHLIILAENPLNPFSGLITNGQIVSVFLVQIPTAVIEHFLDGEQLSVFKLRTTFGILIQDNRFGFVFHSLSVS